jgi:hypothetical protein
MWVAPNGLLVMFMHMLDLSRESLSPTMRCFRVLHRASGPGSSETRPCTPVVLPVNPYSSKLREAHNAFIQLVQGLSQHADTPDLCVGLHVPDDLVARILHCCNANDAAIKRQAMLSGPHLVSLADLLCDSPSAHFPALACEPTLHSVLHQRL